MACLKIAVSYCTWCAPYWWYSGMWIINTNT